MMAAVIGRLAALEVKQGHIKRMVGKLADTIQSNFERLNWSFNQVVGQLTAMEQTLELTSDLRYKEGFEKIEGAYAALLKGAHNLQAMLGELKGFIFELNTENVRHLSSTRLQEYLELVQRPHGSQAAQELASYVVTVKAKSLIMVRLHDSYVADFRQVQHE